MYYRLAYTCTFLRAYGRYRGWQYLPSLVVYIEDGSIWWYMYVSRMTVLGVKVLFNMHVYFPWDTRLCSAILKNGDSQVAAYTPIAMYIVSASCQERMVYSVVTGLVPGRE